MRKIMVLSMVLGFVSLTSASVRFQTADTEVIPGDQILIEIVADFDVAGFLVGVITSSAGGTAALGELNPGLSLLPFQGELVNDGTILLQGPAGTVPFGAPEVPAGEILYSFTFQVPQVPASHEIIIDEYSENFWVTSINNAFYTIIIEDIAPLTLNFTGTTAAWIGTSPKEISYYFYHEDIQNQVNSFTLTNHGLTDLNWYLDEECDWIEVNPNAGILAHDESIEIQVTVDPNKLVPGQNTYDLLIIDPSAYNSPHIITVNAYKGNSLIVPMEYSSLKTALTAASKYDTILVEDGIYLGPDNRNLYVNTKVISSINGPNNCIIDCQNAGRAFTINSGGFVSGFTIINGSTNDGGAISMGNESSLEDCVISGCNANDKGGGIDIYGSDAYISKCLVYDSVALNGGGVYCDADNAIIENCRIIGSFATYNGGGLYCANSTTEIKDSLITGNVCVGDGGGIYAEAGTNLLLSNCDISVNEAYQNGGGLYFFDSCSPTISDCSICFNSADLKGGGIYSMSNCSPVLLYSDINGNTAVKDGGGFYLSGGSAELSNCQVNGNLTLDDGGGIYANAVDLAVHSCTMTENKSSTVGGGLFALFSDVEIFNSIFWGGHAMVAKEIALNMYSTAILENSNLSCAVDGSSSILASQNMIYVNPIFHTPGYWLGQVWVEGDYHLHTDSPCVDAGSKDLLTAVLDKDMDGQPRVVGANTDIGADEYVMSGDFNHDNFINYLDFSILSSNWNMNGTTPQNESTDLNEDGTLDLTDCTLFSTSWLSDK